MALNRMMIVFIGCLVSLNGSQAHVDYGANVGAISYPIGAAATGWLGYNQLLWGEKTPETSSENPKVLYGFVRPELRASSSVAVNRIGGQVELYPVAPFGISVGADRSFHHAWVTRKYPCSVVPCGAVLDRLYVRARGVVGYSNFFLTGSFRHHFLRPFQSQLKFYDEISQMLGGPGQDRLDESAVMAGYRMTDSISILGAWMRVKLNAPGAESNHLLGMGVYQWDAFRVMGGAGYLFSNFHGNSPLIAVVAEWVGSRSLSLF